MYARGMTRSKRILIVLAIAATSLVFATPAQAGTHTVRSGETLSHIAIAHGVSWRSIASANGISSPYIVRVGQKLQIPGSSSSSSSSSSGRHTVRAGETLSHIGARYGVSWRSIASANGISSPYVVRVGQRLTIPGGSSSSSASSSSSSGRIPPRVSRSAIETELVKWARHYGIKVDLVKAMAKIESGWQQHVVSSAGAIGVMQLMPGTAAWLDTLLPGSQDPYNYRDNIQMGVYYILRLIRLADGDARLAIGSYYQGWGATLKYGLYDETEVYVNAVQAARSQYR